MATHPSTLAWRIPWTEEPGELSHSIGLRGVGHHCSDLACMHYKNVNIQQNIWILYHYNLYVASSLEWKGLRRWSQPSPLTWIPPWSCKNCDIQQTLIFFQPISLKTWQVFNTKFWGLKVCVNMHNVLLIK